jgi:hypothetical protein
MKHIQHFDEFLNESIKFKKNDKFKHIIYPDVTGTIVDGPLTFKELEKIGYDMPETADLPKEQKADLNKKAWYGIILYDKVTKFGLHESEIKKA